MRQLSNAICWGCAAWALAGGMAAAQVDLSGWPQVRMQVLAVDRDGNPISGMTAEGLVAVESGKPRPVSELKPIDAPQSVCVLIDASDSLGDGLSMVRTKAERLLKKLPADDEVCVAVFAKTLVIAQPLTQDRGAVLERVEGVKPAGGTQLRDALLGVADYMREKSANRSRAIILFSDGADRRSSATRDALQRGLESEGSPVVHMVVLPRAFGRARAKQADPEESAAFRITGLGGGMTYFPHTMGDMNGIMEMLPQAMRSRYELTFTAGNVARDGHEERVEVLFDKANRNDNAVVQAPEGYYAPRP